MCGINGLLDLQREKSSYWEREAERTVRRMNDALAHRGPDGEGSFVCYPIILGHRRLSIIDLTDKASQPMSNETKDVSIVFNGEIYNYLELVPDLKSKGHVFKSKSDTEVILHAYEEYGTECVHKFNGMWAFAIYDFKRNILFASRDRLGVKPFFYHQSDKSFIFSSEIKGILQAAGINEANLGKVYDYLAYGYKTNDGLTFFRGVQELRPGHNLLVEGGRVRTFQYWSLPDSDGHREYHCTEDYIQEFSELFRNAVRIRFRSDVPVALTLSGGLDSSSIAKATDRMIAEASLGQSEVTAFSALFPGSQVDESYPISELTKTFHHIKWQAIYPTGLGLLDVIDEVIFSLEEPFLSTSVYAHNAIMKEIHNRGVKVAMTGQGSDETFAGYDRYVIGYFLLDRLMENPARFMREIRAINSRMEFSIPFILSQIFKAILPRRRASFIRSKYLEKIISCLNTEFVKNNYSYFSDGQFANLGGTRNNLDDYLKFHMHYQGFGQILHYEDRSSMQHSIELRSPFIDYRLVEFGFKIPAVYKIDKGRTKMIIRKAIGKDLPWAISHNYKKIGFATPFDKWMDNARLQSFIDDLLSSSSFNNKAVWKPEKIRFVFRNRNRYPRFPFWRVINLEIWSKLYGITNL